MAMEGEGRDCDSVDRSQIYQAEACASCGGHYLLAIPSNRHTPGKLAAWLAGKAGVVIHLLPCLHLSKCTTAPPPLQLFTIFSNFRI